MLDGRRVICVCAVLCVIFWANGASAQNKPVAEAKELSARIDRIVLNRMREAKLLPARPANEAILFRRLHLDLAGRIPDLLEVQDFLGDDRPNRLSIWVEKLLESDRHVDHFVNVWRSILIPNKDDNQNLAQQRSFENWMRQQLKNERPYDEIAKNLLTGLRKAPTDSAPSAFYIANENKAETMAAATARVLLGVRLECAQCHAHPFAKWTREDFWSMAAFFNRRNVRYSSDGQYLRPRMAVGSSKRSVEATFLDGTKPSASSKFNGPTVLANWIANKKNPYFSKATVDHLWKYFIGASLFEPILQEEENTLTHPELLDTLAREFAEHEFDLKYLIRAIVYSKIYQRTSNFGKADKDNPAPLAYFARMPVRGLSPEQLYDSFMVATKIKRRDPPPIIGLTNSPLGRTNNPRMAFLRKFAGATDQAETSIIQALFLMNGDFLSKRINARKADIIPVLAEVPIGADGRIDTLYRIVLSRPPRPEEVSRLRHYVEKGGPTGNRVEALADIYWALLNSAEFRLNH